VGCVRILHNADFVVKKAFVGGILWPFLEQLIVNSIGWLGRPRFDRIFCFDRFDYVLIIYGYPFVFLGITQVAMATQTEFVVQKAGGHKGRLSFRCFGLCPIGGLIVTFFPTLKVRMTKMTPD